MRIMKALCLALFTACCLTGCGGGLEPGMSRDAAKIDPSFDPGGGVVPKLNTSKHRSNNAGR